MQSQSPIIDLNNRKCRDIFCTAFFLLFWIAMIIIIVTYNSSVGGFNIQYLKNITINASRVIERAKLQIQPGDDIRRMCGFAAASQPDYLSPDYSSYANTYDQMAQLCTAARKLDATILTDCSTLTKAATIRPFMDLLKTTFNDMSGYPVGLKTLTGTVCISRKFCGNGSDCSCDQIPVDAKYVCHREFAEFAAQHGVTITSQYLSNSAYLAAVSILAAKNVTYLNNMCQALPTYTGAALSFRTDYIKPSAFVTFNAEYCSQDYVNLLKEQVATTVSGLSSNVMVSYLMNYFNDAATYIIAELQQQWVWILISCLLSFVVAYLLTFLIKFIIAIIIWGIAILLIVGVSLIAAWLLYTAVQMDNENAYRLEMYGYSDANAASRAQTLKVLGGIVATIACILILAFCCFIKSIRIAIAVIGVASEALRKMFGMLLLPLFFIPVIIFHLVWTVGAAYLYQCMSTFNVKYNQFNFVIVTQDITTKVFTESVDYLGLSLFLVLVFGVIWGVFFLYACLEYLISSMVTQWYFSAEPRRTKGFLGRGFRMLFKSLGTVAAASYIVSIVVLIRWFFEYLLKRLEQSGKIAKNKLTDTVTWIIRIGLAALQKFVQYTNRNAQVLATITGENYCKSAGLAMKYQFTNLKSVIVLNTIGDFALFLTKVAIAGISAFFCWLMCRYGSYPTMVVTPVVVTFILSYFVAFYVVEILELTIDTVFMAFLYENEHMQKDREQGRMAFAPAALAKLLDVKTDTNVVHNLESHSESVIVSLKENEIPNKVAIFPASRQEIFNEVK